MVEFGEFGFGDGVAVWFVLIGGVGVTNDEVGGFLEIDGFEVGVGVSLVDADGAIGFDIDGSTTGGAAHLDVAVVVTDNPALGEIDIKIAGCLVDHAGFWFSQGAVLAVFFDFGFGVVGAIVDGIEIDAVGG